MVSIAFSENLGGSRSINVKTQAAIKFEISFIFLEDAQVFICISFYISVVASVALSIVTFGDKFQQNIYEKIIHTKTFRGYTSSSHNGNAGMGEDFCMHIFHLTHSFPM